MIRSKILLVLALSILAGASPSRADERKDRNTDRAALSTLDSGIAKLKRSYGSRALTEAERELYLSKLAEMQLMRGEFFFRIDHGEAHLRKSALTLSRSIKAYGVAVETLIKFLALHPNSTRVPWALFSKAKAYEEMGEIAHAKADYLKFVERFPNDERCDPSYMALAAFANADENSALAAKYLLEVEKHPDSPYYATALHQLSWAYYNLKLIRKALDTIARHFAILRDLKDDDFAENAAGDIALFYLEGYESSPSEFGIPGAMKEIEKSLGKKLAPRTYVRFGRLLKAHGHLEALSRWRELVFDNQGAGEESSEIASLLLEERFARREWKMLDSAIHDLLRSTVAEGRPKAEKRLLEMAEEIQKMVLKNLASTEVKILTQALATVYDSFAEGLPGSDARVGQAHYNLAEAYFRTEEYAAATKRYRMAIGSVKDAELKSVSSRHLELKRAKLIPESLSASLVKGSESKIPGELREWIGWIDVLKASGKTIPGAEGFAFDAARALYARGEREESMKRLLDLAQHASDGKLRLAAAALVLDTHVAASDWEAVHKTADSFLLRKDWVDSAFPKRLETLASDSFFQITLARSAKGSTEEKLEAASECAKLYPKGTHAAECALLGGKAAIELGLKDNAKTLLQSAGDLEGALLLSASIQESEMDLISAIASLTRSLAKKPDDGVRKQILYLSWVSGDSKKLEEALKSPLICGHASAPKECETYRLVKSLKDGHYGDRKRAFQMSTKAPLEHRAIWTLMALRSLGGAKGVPFQDRIVLLQRLGDAWKGLPTDIAILLAGEGDSVIAESLSPIEKSIPSIAPLAAEEGALLKRVRILQESEKALAKAALLPFARTKLRLLATITRLHRSFVTELTALIASHPDLKGPLGDLLKPLTDKTEGLESQMADSSPIARIPALDHLGSPLPVSILWKGTQGLAAQALLYRAGAEKDSDRAQFLRGLAFLEAGALAEGAQLISERLSDLDGGDRVLASLLVLTRDWEGMPKETLLPFVNLVRSGRGPTSEDVRARIVRALEESGLFGGRSS